MAVLSPLAVMKNGLILATIRKRNFARTSFHIFLGRLAMTDFLGDLIGGPLHALSILVKAFTDSTLSQDNSAHLSSVREALFVFFPTITIFTMTLMCFQTWMQMSR